MKLLLILLVFIVSGQIGAVEVRIVTGQTNISLDDQLRFEVVFKGARSVGDIPRIDGIENFDIQSTGQSSNITIVNGSMTTEKTFEYLVYPKSEGTFKLGPVRINIAGKDLKSNIVEIIVSTKNNIKKNASGKQPNESFFIETKVDNPNPYIYQQILYTFRFFNRGGVSNAKRDAWPKFEGFWAEEFSKQRNYSKLINGVQWSVIEVAVALYPTQVGEIEVPPVSLIASVVDQRSKRSGINNRSFLNSFFDNVSTMKNIRLRSSPVVVNVKALPKVSSGQEVFVVGNLLAESTLSKNNLSVGDSTTLTIKISGDANVRDVKVNKIISDDFKIYEDKPQFSKFEKSKLIIGEKIFKFAFVPQKEGELTIPTFSIDYFHVKSNEYKKLKTDTFLVNVSPSEDDSTLQMFNSKKAINKNIKKEIKILGKDLMSLKRSLTLDKYNKISMWDYFYFFMVLFLSILINIVFLLFKRQRRIRSGDKNFYNRSNSMKIFLSNVEVKKGRSLDLSFIISNFKEFIGNKFDFDGKALTEIEITSKLNGVVADNIIVDIVEFIKRYEMEIYGGNSKKIDLSQVKKRSIVLAKSILRGQK